MAEQPQASTPEQAGDWAATIAVYRFLNNDRITPEAINASVVEQTRRVCADRDVILCVHDLTPLDPVYAVSDTQLQQHTVLAIDGGDSGEVLGLLAQRWFDDPKTPPRETRAQRRARWTRSQVWPEAVKATQVEDEDQTRRIMVADREADDFQVFTACQSAGQGWVIRSQHNRYLHDSNATSPRLRSTLAQAPVAGQMSVAIERRLGRQVALPPARWRKTQTAREARVQVRCQAVTLAPPMNDPRYEKPLTINAVYAVEVDAPDDVDKLLDWVLLTSEPVDSWEDAQQVIQWYRRRWLIEQFHKAQKTGCRLEQSQLHTSEAICRLAAITSAVAVRLLQLRLAAHDHCRADTLAHQQIDPMWVHVVAMLANADPQTMTLTTFYHTIARKGGWLARKHDGPPGWQTLYRGWRHIAEYITGIELFKSMPRKPK